MDFKNLLGLGKGALLFRLAGRRKPLNVMLSVTNRCDGTCRYCGIPQRRTYEMSTDEIKRLIDECVAMGTERLGLWGGEPLIRNDIGEIIDHAKKRGLFVTLDSNGHLLSRRIDAIRNLDIIIVSLDGEEDVHDANRGEGAYRKVIRGIEALKASELTLPIWTITVLTRSNIGRIDEIVRLGDEYGLFMTFQVLHHSESLADETESLLPSDEEHKAGIERLKELKRGGSRIVSSFRYFDHLLSWTDFRSVMGTEDHNDLRCLAGELYCNIDTDGRVYPCSLLVGEQEGKDALTEGMKAAFDACAGPRCRSCNASCFVEYNFLFGLAPGVIWNWFRMIRRRTT